jgi:hypothetical protein
VWQTLELSHRLLMLSDKQRRTALKKNIAHARDMARRLLADGVEAVTLTYYADEGSFRAMRLPEEGDDFEHRQPTNAEIAKVMLAHGLDLKVQVLNAEGILHMARGAAAHLSDPAGISWR